MKEALGLGLALVVGVGVLGFGQMLSGKWSADFTLREPSGDFDLHFVSVLDIDYTVGNWRFGSHTKLDSNAVPFWTGQYFDALCVFSAFTITSKLEFDPAGVALRQWTTATTASIADVTFSAKLELAPTAAKLTLGGTGVASNVTTDVTVVLNDLDIDPGGACDLGLSSVKIKLRFPLCCATISSELHTTCDGFDYVGFCTTGITITSLSWLTLDACVKLHTGSKLLTLSPKLDLNVIACDFDLYCQLGTTGDTDERTPDNPLNIEGFSIDGIQISCEINGVKLTSISYWGDGSSGILSGYGDYWEAWQIATTDGACCGPFSLAVTVFFDCDAASLLDVALLVANMSIEVATQLTLDTTVEVDLAADIVDKWAFGFVAEW